MRQYFRQEVATGHKGSAARVIVALAIIFAFATIVIAPTQAEYHAYAADYERWEDCDWDGYDDHTGVAVPWPGFDGTKGDTPTGPSAYSQTGAKKKQQEEADSSSSSSSSSSSASSASSAPAQASAPTPTSTPAPASTGTSPAASSDTSASASSKLKGSSSSSDTAAQKKETQANTASASSKETAPATAAPTGAEATQEVTDEAETAITPEATEPLAAPENAPDTPQKNSDDKNLAGIIIIAALGILATGALTFTVIRKRKRALRT